MDDDEEWTTLLDGVLRPEFDVQTANSGSEGLRMATIWQPDIILLDVVMAEGADGFTVLLQLRRNSGTADIPVVMLSGINQAMALSFTDRVLHQHLGEAPARFVEKPVSPDDLVAVIRDILGNPG